MDFTTIQCFVGGLIFAHGFLKSFVVDFNVNYDLQKL